MPEESSDAATGSRAEPPETPKVPVEGAPTPTEDWSTRYKYLLADFDNFRRRVERDRESISRQARAGLVRELLPIIEAFRGARESFARLPASDPMRKGLDLLDHEWSKFLKHEGVEPVAEAGGPFRAEEAEAVGEIPASEAQPEGSIAEVVQQGYRFFGGLLRPAKVIVARAHRAATAEGSSPEGTSTKE
ncbi:MAG TPA: nucleotide exchange factor GrpE [Thermoplasmata archaeon]|nr:nucleotide exchange factor GrpE [Thermoplasmata archaeon]